MQAKTQALQEKYGIVSQLNSERSLQLERAQSLASQFWETYDEMWPWLQETLRDFSQLAPPSIEYETLKQQQEELRVRPRKALTVLHLLINWALSSMYFFYSKCGSLLRSTSRTSTR